MVQDGRHAPLSPSLGKPAGNMSIMQLTSIPTL